MRGREVFHVRSKGLGIWIKGQIFSRKDAKIAKKRFPL
jgi:hypothetical protein